MANCSPVCGELHANSRELGERLAHVRQVREEVAGVRGRKKWQTFAELQRSSFEFVQVCGELVFAGYSAKNTCRK
ncbi:MAG: hypothetical protein GY820_25625 [Gammaproteobacteria bacterium]|nr:hypothetical protein [Gammaproteobacteria bacterium]